MNAFKKEGTNTFKNILDTISISKLEALKQLIKELMKDSIPHISIPECSIGKIFIIFFDFELIAKLWTQKFLV